MNRFFFISKENCSKNSIAFTKKKKKKTKAFTHTHYIQQDYYCNTLVTVYLQFNLWLYDVIMHYMHTQMTLTPMKIGFQVVRKIKTNYECVHTFLSSQWSSNMATMMMMMM